VGGLRIRPGISFFSLLAWPTGMPTQRMKHENKKRHEQATTGSRKVTLGT